MTTGLSAISFHWVRSTAFHPFSSMDSFLARRLGFQRHLGRSENFGRDHQVFCRQRLVAKKSPVGASF